MSALAGAYTQTFRPVAPLQGTVFDNGSDMLLGQMPMQTAALIAPLAQTGLNNQAQLANTTLVNRQRTLEQKTEIAALEKQRKQWGSCLPPKVMDSPGRATATGQGWPPLRGRRPGTRRCCRLTLAQQRTLIEPDRASPHQP